MNIYNKMAGWLSVLISALMFISFTQMNLFADELDWNVSIPGTTLWTREKGKVWIQYAQDKAGNITFLVVTKNQKSGALVFVARSGNQNTAFLKVGKKKLPPPNTDGNFIFVDGETVVKQKISLQGEEWVLYLKGYLDGYARGEK